MLEIEMKFRVVDYQAVKAKLTAWQARADSPIDEADHYFNAPDRDFAQTDEALRLRRIGTINLATYKGPKQAGPAKTRTEIEVPLAEGDEAAELFRQMLTNLRYRPVAVVRKRRAIYHFDRDGFSLQCCLDEVEHLGRFVEVEIVAPNEQKAAAEAVLQEVAHELGLTNSEKRAYLQLLLEKQNVKG
jgi:adenylate cyclase class 2